MVVETGEWVCAIGTGSSPTRTTGRSHNFGTTLAGLKQLEFQDPLLEQPQFPFSPPPVSAARWPLTQST